MDDTLHDVLTFGSNLLVFLGVLAGIWQSRRAAEQAKRAVSQGEQNAKGIQILHESVNGVLAATKSDTLRESDRLLKTSTTAAHAEGVLEGRGEAPSAEGSK